MAVDSWLLTQEIPVLRLYHWKGLWGSMGYFGEVEKAGKLLPEVSLVRRATGGGLVDHRNDITYTLRCSQNIRSGESEGSRELPLDSFRVSDRVGE